MWIVRLLTVTDVKCKEGVDHDDLENVPGSALSTCESDVLTAAVIYSKETW